MSSAAYNARIDRVVARYEAGGRPKAFRISQIAGIRGVLEGIHDCEEDELGGADWELLLATMRAWREAWEAQLVDKYVGLRRQARAVRFPGTGDVGEAVPEREDGDLACYEAVAFEQFQSEAWTGRFVTCAREFYECVERFNESLQEKLGDKRSKGRRRGRMSYADVQQKYTQLLQHVFDVPTLDDRSRMGYEALPDPSGIQPLLQADGRWQELLGLAGLFVMWAADDELEPSHHELPDLFHDMEHFYGCIAGKLEERFLAGPGPAQIDLESLLRQLEIEWRG